MASIAPGPAVIAGDAALLRYTCREAKIGKPDYRGRKLIVLEQREDAPIIGSREPVTIRRFSLKLYEGQTAQDNAEILKTMPVEYTGDARYFRKIDELTFISDRNRLMELNTVFATIKRHKSKLSHYMGIHDQFYIRCDEEMVPAR